MDALLTGPARPQFRPAVEIAIGETMAQFSIGRHQCAFGFAAEDHADVVALVDCLRTGGVDADEIASLFPVLAGHIPTLLQDFDRLRLIQESDRTAPPTRSGAQLYRDVRRAADRAVARTARSAFYRALVEDRASAAQLIGYALEYFWLVKMAPGLIAPALASAHTPRERALLQDFLKSELGHDAFLARALKCVGVDAGTCERHLPLPATFALGASLGVYARQHPLSFRAGLFLFERAQPDFIEAFDGRCRRLGLPEGFYLPLRKHADLNEGFDHGDISRLLLSCTAAVSDEEAATVKRHVVLLAETMVWQEEQILEFHAVDRPVPARLSG
jgi:hypothetical protein